MIVVDASALVDGLLFHGPGPAEIRRALVQNEGRVAAPHHVDVEVLSGIHRLERRRIISGDRAQRAVRALQRFQVDRYPTTPLLGRAFALRRNVSVYDGIYIALAEALGATLLTRDHRLARAPGIRAPVHVVG